MATPQLQLPLRFRLVPSAFPSLAANSTSSITVTVPNTLRTHTLNLPTANAAGILSNDGFGKLTWTNPSTSSVGLQNITASTLNNFGIVALTQTSTGSCSIKFSAPVGGDYNLGIDQLDAGVFKLSHSSALGSSDLIKFSATSLVVPANLTLSETNVNGLVGVFKMGTCNFYALNTSNNLFIGKNTGTLTFSGATRNTALGRNAMSVLTSGYQNTAVGESLANLSSGYMNVGVGVGAGIAITSGTQNTAIGANSLAAFLDGNSCTAVGYNALPITIGDRNTAVGANAGSINVNGTNSVYIGYNANPATTALSNTIVIGSGAYTSSANSVQIGNSSISLFGVGSASLTVNQLIQLINLPDSPIPLLDSAAWTSLAGMDQDLNTTSSPTFANLNITGTLYVASVGITTITSSVATLNSNTVLNATYSIIRAHAGAAPITLTLPVSGAKPSQEIKITKVDLTSNAITLLCQGSNTIAYSYSSFRLTMHGESIHLVDMGDGCWNIF